MGGDLVYIVCVNQIWMTLGGAIQTNETSKQFNAKMPCL